MNKKIVSALIALLIIGSCIHYNFFSSYTYTSFLFFTVLSLILICYFSIQSFGKSIKLSISYLDILVLVHLAYIFIHSIANHVELLSERVLSIFLASILYFILRNIDAKQNFWINIFTLSILLQFIVVVLTVAKLIPLVNSMYTLPTGTFANPNSLGMFLVIPTLFIINAFFTKQVNKASLRFYILIATVIIAIGLMIITQCRTAIIALAIGLIILLAYWLKNYVVKLSAYIKILIACVLIFALAAPVFFLFKGKESSTKGRILVWLVSTNIIKDNPIGGVGYGNFNSAYNKYQISFFKANGLNHKYSQLAGTPLVAYNAPLQAWVEGGIIGFLLLCGILLYPIIYLLSKIWRKENIQNNLFHLSLLLSITAMCMINFFFSEYALLLLFTICISIVPTHTKHSINLYGKQYSVVGTIISVAVCIIIVTQVGKQAYGRFYLHKMTLLKKPSYTNEEYLNIAGKYIGEDDMLLYYQGLNAYEKGNFSEAVSYLTKANKKTNSYSTFQLLGMTYSKTKNYAMAESYFTNAMYQIPYRFRPRYSLMNIYIQQGDMKKAKEMAKSIINLKVKVPSEEVRKMREYAQHVIQM